MIINSLDKENIKFPDKWDSNTIIDFEQFVKKYVRFADSLFENEDEKEDKSIINIDIDNKTFRLSDYCGEIIFNGEIFHIYPFTFDKESIDKNSSKAFSLFYANINLYLEEFLNVKFSKVLKTKDDSDDTLLEILITIFVKEIEDKLKNKPLYSYIECHDSLNKLVGRLNVNDYFRNYVNGKKHLLACDYSNFSFNNPINKVLKFTINKLLKIAKNRQNVSRLKRLSVLFDEVDDSNQKEIENIYRTLIFNQLNKDYENLILLSQILINGLNYNDTTNVKSNSDRTNFCFLFKMNVLFEKFISARLNDYLKNRFKGNDIKNYPQTRKKKLFKDLNKFPLKPDNVIMDKDENVLAIIDTKYKRMENFDIRNSSNDDLYQVAVYNLIYKPKIAILMYPLLSKEENKVIGGLDFKTLNNADSTFESKVAVMSVPLIFSEEEIGTRNFSRLYNYFALIFKDI